METLGAIFVWMFFGLVVGIIARLVVPGRQPLGWLGTIGLGVLGSFVGGFIAYLFQGGEPLQPAKWLMSILGAVVVLVLSMSMSRRRAV